MNIAEMNYPFADGVANLIRDKGLKQIYIAKKAGYKAQELTDMLNGRRLIKVCDVQRLALALGVGIDEIYSVGKKEEVIKENG